MSSVPSEFWKSSLITSASYINLIVSAAYLPWESYHSLKAPLCLLTNFHHTLCWLKQSSSVLELEKPWFSLMIFSSKCSTTFFTQDLFNNHLCNISCNVWYGCHLVFWEIDKIWHVSVIMLGLHRPSLLQIIFPYQWCFTDGNNFLIDIAGVVKGLKNGCWIPLLTISFTATNATSQQQTFICSSKLLCCWIIVESPCRSNGTKEQFKMILAQLVCQQVSQRCWPWLHKILENTFDASDWKKSNKACFPPSRIHQLPRCIFPVQQIFKCNLKERLPSMFVVDTQRWFEPFSTWISWVKDIEEPINDPDKFHCSSNPWNCFSLRTVRQ